MSPIRVGITQAREDGEKSASLLRDAGFEAVLLPQICFARTNATIPAGDYDACLLTSPRVVRSLAASTDGTVRWERVVAIHPRTALEAERAGFVVDKSVEPGNAAELIAALPSAPPALRVLFPRGDLADPASLEALREAGHEVCAPTL